MLQYPDNGALVEVYPSMRSVAICEGAFGQALPCDISVCVVGERGFSVSSHSHSP